MDPQLLIQLGLLAASVKIAIDVNAISKKVGGGSQPIGKPGKDIIVAPPPPANPPKDKGQSTSGTPNN